MSVSGQDNILAAVQWLMTGCQPQDSLVFAFCGLCVTNSDASELDGDFREGEEEGLLPCDFERVCQHLLRVSEL